MRSSKREISTRCAALALVVISIAAATGCGGSGSSKNNNNNNNNNNQVIAGPGPNVVSLTLDGGPAAFQQLGSSYLNGVFVTVNVCLPGTATCQTIDHLLVDTGSIGLRLLDSSSGGEFDRSVVPLVQENGTDGNPVGECVQFVDGSFLWGPVATADVKISSETASAVPVHIVGDNTFAHAAPLDCSSNNTGNDADSLQSLGANGILGVGNLQGDCPGCVSTVFPHTYYSCTAPACANAAAPAAKQVQNPVALFATDNNGVILEIPPVASAGVQSVTNPNGVLVFGIGTQSNNALGNASVLTLDDFLTLTASYKGVNYPGSFVDSGSNALFFLDSGTTGISGCSDATAFYCPSSTQNLTATNTGQNGTSTTVSFSIGNFDSLANSSNVIFSNVGGPNSGSFDWGSPFFMGRNVFVAIQGKTAPGGTPPYVAY